MKVLNLDTLPEGGTVVVPVVEPLYEQCPERRHYIVGDVRRHDVHDDVRCPRPCRNLPDGRRGWPYVGRVALSVWCGKCGGNGWFDPPDWNRIGGPCGRCDCKGRLIVASAEVEFVPVFHIAWAMGNEVPRPNVQVNGPSVASFATGDDCWPLDAGLGFRHGEWAAVLTDVRTTERCPACGSGRWAGTGTCLPIPHDGGEEWEP